MIYDGETDYRNEKDNYYDQAMDIINGNNNLPPEISDFIEDYFGSI